MISVSTRILLIHPSNPANSIPKFNWRLIINIGPIPYDHGSNELKHVQKIFVNRISKLTFLRDCNYNKYMNEKQRTKRMNILTIYLLSEYPQITIPADILSMVPLSYLNNIMRYHLEADSSNLFFLPALIFTKLVSAG
jgi:hypothetical protein